MDKKKFIAPGGWFSLEYPLTWNEFEDEEGSFLFYNPDCWKGNFRISAFKDASAHYAADCLADELKANRSARKVHVGEWECAFSAEDFQEDGEKYTTYFWITGKGNLSIECSFTVKKGEPATEAENIIASLVERVGKQPKEIIPVRVLEINEINEAYEWASSMVKKLLKKDFTGEATDIARIQEVIDGDRFKPEQRDCWSALGIAFGSILVNEMDGMEWVTIVEGKREYPALRFAGTDVMVYPTELIWEKKHKGEACHLQQEFDRIKNEVEAAI